MKSQSKTITRFSLTQYQLTLIFHQKSTATPSQAVFSEDARTTVLNIQSSMFPGFGCRISDNPVCTAGIRRFVTISSEKYWL